MTMHILRLLRPLARQFNAQFIAPRQSYVAIKTRLLSSSWVSHASESPSFRDSALFRQLSTNPAALQALKDFAQLMKDEGIEFSVDKPPSQLHLFKLLANSKFRNGALKLKEDLEKAGVDVDPDSAMEMLNAFKAEHGDK